MGLLSALRPGKIRTPLVGILHSFGVHKCGSPQVGLCDPQNEIRRRVVHLGVPESDIAVTGIPDHASIRGQGRGAPRPGSLPRGVRSLVMGECNLGPVEERRSRPRATCPLAFNLSSCGTNRRDGPAVRSLTGASARTQIPRSWSLGRSVGSPDAADNVDIEARRADRPEALAKGRR